MNKIILMGRLTRDPQTRYTSGSNPTAITNFSLAVNRRFKKDGEADVDFINCITFGKSAEFVNNYFKKGQMVSVVGRLQTSSWDDKTTGQKKYKTEVVVEENYFAESRKSFENNNDSNTLQGTSDDNYDGLPFS